MANSNYLTIGKWLFIIAVLGLGILHVTSGQMIPNFTLAAWMPLKPVTAYLTGLALVAAGVLIATKYALPGTYVAASIFAVFLVFLLIPKLIMNLRDSAQYTFISETFMFFSGSLMLWGNMLIEKGNLPKGSKIFIAGKYIFALTLFDFGMEHWLSEPYVVSIIPTWIPWKDFWAYLVMFAFFAASISLFINKLAKVAMQLLFLMFFLWVVLLHLPQVVSNPGNAVLWSFFFVPVGVCGIALVVAGSLRVSLKKPRA